MAKARTPTIYDSFDFPDYEFREYPKLFYSPSGGEITVNSAEEAAVLDKATWFDHPSCSAPTPDPVAKTKA